MQTKFRKILIAFAVCCLFIFSFCERETIYVTPTIYVPDTTTYDFNKAIYNHLKEWYLWYDSIPVVADFHSYLKPQDFLNTILYKQKDRWSFIITKQEYDNYFVKGKVSGKHGFLYSPDTSNHFRIALVFQNSDLYKFGVRRGWIIEKINNIVPDTSNITELLGKNEIGIQNTFLFKKPDNSEVSQSFTKNEITENMVLYRDTLHVDEKVVGYLVFYGFLANAETELNEAFDFFKSTGSTELVLDLRYNGGGNLNIANYLASIIGGTIADNQLFTTLTYNNKKSANNSIVNIKRNGKTINLARLFVITTNKTASASEALINGLSPYMDVKLIGSRTHGKPVGMNIWNILPKNYVIAPVTFKLTNKNNYGDYFSGLPVDKEAFDDVYHDFGDRNEACLKQALYYIKYGNFAPSLKVRYVPFNHRWKGWEMEVGIY